MLNFASTEVGPQFGIRFDVSNLRLQLAEFQSQLDEYHRACLARELAASSERAKLLQTLGVILSCLRSA